MVPPRRHEATGSSLHVLEPGLSANFSPYSSSEEELLSRESNDRRLRQAINYLRKEGKPDSASTYVDRVQKIYDGIIKQYREERYLFDPALYRELQTLVREVQSDIQRIANEESSVDLDGSDKSVEELLSPEALYREELDEADCPPLPFNRRTSRATASSSSSGTPPLKADVLKTEYYYGGPKNEVEEWYKDFPAALPFGETLYTQAWESMKIDYDLAESVKKSATDKNPIVTTNVPYGAVKKHFTQVDQFDSGSRFKLPLIPRLAKDQIAGLARKISFSNAVEEFNAGGPVQEQIEKDYVPRVFVPRVSVTNPTPYMSAKARGKQPVGRLYSPPTMAEFLSDRFPTQTIDTGTIHPDATPILRKHSRNSSLPPTKATKTDSKAIKSSLKRFEERRAAATKCTAPPATQKGEAAKKTSKKYAPTANTSASRHNTYVQAEPARKPGRPRKIPVSESPLPNPSTIRSAPNGTKRKLSTASSTYTPSVKKAKVTKKAPITTRAASTLKKSVMFSEQKALPTSKLGRGKAVITTNGAIGKAKRREMGSVPELLAADLKDEKCIKRGFTRNGKGFRP